MAPPGYADLGKQARDIFSKGYHFGVVKLDCQVKSDTSKEFVVSGTSNNDSGKVAASMESKYKITDWGITFKEKWNTDSVLTTGVEVDEKLLKGLKHSFDCTFVPQSGKKVGSFKQDFKLEYVQMNTEINGDLKEPCVHLSGVLGIQGWLAGAQISFDPIKTNILKNNFALGYAVKDFVLLTNVNDGQEFGGSVYQKVTPNLETGVQVVWTSNSNTTKFSLGCVYSVDSYTSLRAKINNSSEIGLGISHQLKEGIQLTLSAMIDGKNLNQGGHKLGLGVDLKA